MRYESVKTARGNVGVSYESQEAADLQASQMDANNCYNCSYCSGCYNCSYCSGCYNCSYCSRCSGCSDCTNCSGCSGCTNCSRCSDCPSCSHCSDCYNCSYCHNCSDCSSCYRCSDCHNCSGVLHWSGSKAERLLTINGLTWPVATDGKSIQIGCQHHSVEAWEGFSGTDISSMEERALEFWKVHKDQILLLAEMRRSMNV